jgi:hypothetical protein
VFQQPGNAPAQEGAAQGQQRRRCLPFLLLADR